ncbi:MAG: N-acetylmuramoyl-L-alanine amidase [Alkalinema sp. RU_4_3]|nr:N-acetylmuramoyl-L-alanine amidase [Alkalinema sp. RU_4_3]
MDRGAIAQELKVVYPPVTHETTAKQIFLLGSAGLEGQVLVNGKAIARNRSGHFAPSFPLSLGSNRFVVEQGGKRLAIEVKRLALPGAIGPGEQFAPSSLWPGSDLARLPGEALCPAVIAQPNLTVTALVGDKKLPLLPQASQALPENSAVLTGKAEQVATVGGLYSGCLVASAPGALAPPIYQIAGTQVTATGKVTVLNPQNLEVVEVTADAGVARTGPSTDFARLTPLPKGSRASMTGGEGEWLRLDYGAWIKRGETKTVVGAVPPRAIIRGVTSRVVGDWTEIVFPLSNPIPIAIEQTNDQFVLSLYNTTSQSDTLKLVDNPIVNFVNWKQVSSDRLDYRFTIRQQQWGYKLRYEGSTLILSLKNPPAIVLSSLPLQGKTILLDPGHGGPEDSGSVGLNGYPEKTVALTVSKLVRDRLVAKGATVVMTREGDIDLLPNDRAKMINQKELTVSLSLHYNALPDDGDAIKTKGMAMFWYHPQSHGLADFMQGFLTKKLGRSNYGVYWNNLAVTRPAVAPAILMELGFMINPDEFDWVRDPKEQVRLADAIAEGLMSWFEIAAPGGSRN